jgi:hypothetical protein
MTNEPHAMDCVLYQLQEREVTNVRYIKKYKKSYLLKIEQKKEVKLL